MSYVKKKLPPPPRKLCSANDSLKVVINKAYYTKYKMPLYNIRKEIQI